MALHRVLLLLLGDFTLALRPASPDTKSSADAPSSLAEFRSDGHFVTRPDAFEQTREKTKYQVETRLKLLLFWAVGGSNDAIDLVMKNIRHARASLHHVDVYLAHYDSNRTAWHSRAGWQWYKDHINFSAQEPGFKFQLAEKLLSSPTDSKFSLDNYDWVWCLDEDIDFSNTPLDSMMHIAEESGSLIALPAFTQIMHRDDHPIQYPIQLPHSECTFRYVPFVEVNFPMLRPAVLKILGTCDHCIHSYSVWGLDAVWCNWSAKQLGHRKDQACIIMDQTPVIHRNFKNLKGKYTGRLQNKAFEDRAIHDRMDVKSHHPIDFVEADSPELVWECVREGMEFSLSREQYFDR